MKKIISVLFVITLFTLSGCALQQTTSQSASTTAAQNTAITLSNNQAMAFSAYMASAFLSSSINNMSAVANAGSNVQYLDNESTTTASGDTTTAQQPLLAIENQLSEVNSYFSTLQVFMDQGFSNVLNLQQTVSDNPSYSNEVSFTINGVTYSIYYNVTPVTNPDGTTTTASTDTTVATTAPVVTTTASTDTTVATTAPVVTTTASTDTTVATTAPVVTTTASTDTTVATTAPVVTTTASTDTTVATTSSTDSSATTSAGATSYIVNGLIVINGAQYQLVGGIDGSSLWFRTIDGRQSGSFVMVKINIENKEQNFNMTTDINGVLNQTRMVFATEKKATMVKLFLNTNGDTSSYQMIKVTQNDQTFYLFNYKIDNTVGQVKVFASTASDGTVTYSYRISENGRSKNITKEHSRFGSAFGNRNGGSGNSDNGRDDSTTSKSM